MNDYMYQVAGWKNIRYHSNHISRPPGAYGGLHQIAEALGFDREL